MLGRADESTAFARVNARWRSGLAASPRVRLVEGEGADVILHHDYEVDFATVSPPSAARRIAVRTWDFGPFPRLWSERVNRLWDRLWVHSRWIAEQAVRGGVEPSRVTVVPIGIDPALFRPDGPQHEPAARAGFRFLFVGATTRRKGVDILLRAYQQAFTAVDDVSLVIKDRATDVFYGSVRHRDEILARAASPGAARIEFVEADLSAEELARLYRSCDVAVFPYRAEGFAIPILEAMACGTPPIVPRFGACLDYCADDRAFFVEPKRIQLPVNRRLTANTLGLEVDVEEVDFCEVPVDVLAEALRAVRAAGREAIRARGERASEVARGNFAWSSVFATIEAELLAPAAALA